jgi:hypothetical protein
LPSEIVELISEGSVAACEVIVLLRKLIDASLQISKVLDKLDIGIRGGSNRIGRDVKLRAWGQLILRCAVCDPADDYTTYDN